MPDETWVVFDDEPKQRVLVRAMRVFLPTIVIGGTAGAFFSRGGDSLVEAFGPIAVAVSFVFWATVGAVGWNVVLWLNAPFAIDLAGRRLRIRHGVVPFEQIERAELVGLSDGDRAGLLLKIGRRRGPAASILLRERSTPVLDDARRDLLIEVIRASSIAPPASPHDPTGKFARFNFPGMLDKAGAEQVVRDPPAPGEPAP
jgi:hypothetical protein